MLIEHYVFKRLAESAASLLCDGLRFKPKKPRSVCESGRLTVAQQFTAGIDRNVWC
jgi:hypothetical protein